MAEEYVTICDVCAKGVTKQDMKYENGYTFHNECYSKSGNNFPKRDLTLQSKTTQAKLDLVQLKNLKQRLVGSKSKTAPKRKTKTKSKKKSTRKTTKRTAGKRKTARKTTRKPARKSTRRKSTRKTTKRRR